MRKSAVIALLCLAPLPLYAQTELVFPQMAVGGNPAYETVLQIVNEVETDNTIVVEVFRGDLAGSSNGTPLPVRFDGGAAATSTTLTLASFQEYTTVITGDSATQMNGWLRVRSTLAGGKLSGNLIYRQRSGSSLLDSVGAPSSQRFRAAIIQVDQRGQGSDTGVALVNPDSTPLDVTVDLFQGPNPAASTLPIRLEPNQHYAKLVSQMFPTFGAQQGTLVIEAAANRTVPCLGMRLDGIQLTSIPVRPLGFTFSYTITTDTGGSVESGFWMFDLVGFNLIGRGKIESPAAADLEEVTGSWVGANFQFRYRKVFPDSTVGMVVFNGTSAGQESLTGSDGKSKAISGKVTTINASGQVVATYNFTAYHKFGPPPQ
jgi:hypothetical protein